MHLDITIQVQQLVHLVIRHYVPHVQIHRLTVAHRVLQDPYLPQMREHAHQAVPQDITIHHQQIVQNVHHNVPLVQIHQTQLVLHVLQVHFSHQI